MSNNESPAAAFQKTHPIGFNLFDDDDQQVLYIDDSPDEHNVNLEIHNTSRQSIDFVKTTPGDNHFELMFRPGTLLAPLEKLALARVYLNGSPINVKLWRIGSAKQTDGSLSILISATDAQPFTLSPDSNLKFTMQNISADRRGGARGTRVELKYRFGYNGDTTQIDGSGVQHISIVNDIGKKYLPLHVGVVGSNTILNDGTDNDRMIRITNLLSEQGDDIGLKTIAEGDEASKFLLSFDVDETWALGKKDNVKGIRVDELDVSGRVVNNVNWKIEPPKDEAQTPEWTIKPLENKTSLRPNESVQFNLSVIRSELRSGPANLYLRYENIPGYKDGQFIITLEKSSLVQRDKLDANNVYQDKSYIGIGTSKPVAPLNIFEKEGTAAGASQGTLVIDHGNSGGANSIVFRSTSNPNSDYGYIQYQDAETVGGGGESSRLIIGVENDNEDHLILKPTGNVGVGTNTPLGKLHVVAGDGGFGGDNADGTSQTGSVPIIAQSNSTAIGILNGNSRQAFALNIDDNGGAKTTRGVPTFYDKYDGNWHPSLSLKNGNVGIGVTDPKAKLDVGGDVKLGTYDLYFHDKNHGIGTYGIDKKFADVDLNGPAVYGWNGGALGSTADGKKIALRWNQWGGVGIGTTEPAGRLNISEKNGTVAGHSQGTLVIDHENNGGASSIVFRSKANRASDFGYIQYQDSVVGGGVESSRLIIGVENDNDDHLILKPTGNVGVGIDSPTAPLHVGNNKTMKHWIKDQYSYVAYTWNSGRSNDFRWGKSDKHGNIYDFPNVSICAEGRVVAHEFNALSDSRIKTNLSVSDPDDDLKLLKQFRVTDYQPKDFLTCGNPHVKGFIADEVEQIFPQAVHKRSDFVPDIYTFAQETSLDNDVLTVTMKEAHDLSAGDTVRLVTQTEGVKDVRVETADEKTFSVRGWKETGSKMFVHGKKVDDFRTLDYQQIFSLGIGGIQQLSKEVDGLREENDELKKRLELLESKFETFANLKTAKKAA